MENTSLEPNSAENADGRLDQESLTAYVERMETDENLEKLAGKLKNEWSESSQTTKPDLSFDRFETKRKGAGRQ